MKLAFVLAPLLVASTWTPPTRVAVAQAPKPLPSIKVDTPKDLEDVQALSELETALTKQVTACVDAGRPIVACRCSYPKELSALRKGYGTLIKQHPSWKDQILSYQYANKEGRNISGVLSIETLRRQLDMLKCE
jgi:hypothetical protein